MFSSESLVTAILPHLSAQQQASSTAKRPAPVVAWRVVRALPNNQALIAVDIAVDAAQDRPNARERIVVNRAQIEVGRPTRVIIRGGLGLGGDRARLPSVDLSAFGQDPMEGKRLLDVRLEAMLEALAREAHITELQESKLRTAGRGDIQRLCSRVEELNAEVISASIKPKQRDAIASECDRLRRRIEGEFFGEGSLFEKTLRRTLLPEQRAARDKYFEDRRQFRYRAKVELLIADLNVPAGLTDAQRRGLAALILDMTTAPDIDADYNQQLVLLKMSEIPPEEVRALLDAEQWDVFEELIKQAAGLKDDFEANGWLTRKRADGAPAEKPVANDAVQP